MVAVQLEIPGDTTLAALSLAHGFAEEVWARPLSVFNPAPAPKELASVFYAATDVLVVNETEARTLTGLSTETMDELRRAALQFLTFGCGVVLLTLGGRGVLVAAQRDAPERSTSSTAAVSSTASRGSDQTSMWQHVDAVAIPSSAVVDTVGAGDAFIGSFCYFTAQARRRMRAQGSLQATLQDDSVIRTSIGLPFSALIEIVVKAQTVAAVSVQSKGAQPSYPARGDLKTQLLE